MKRLYRFLPLGLIAILLFIGCSDPERRAVVLQKEASQLVQSAQEAGKRSYSAAAACYQTALTKAEELISHYPSSSAAQQLSQGEGKIGPYTFADLQHIIVPQAKHRAEAEEDPLACALLLAKTVEEPVSRAGLISTIGDYYDELGQQDRLLLLINVTDDTESAGRVLSETIARRLNPDHYEQAIQIMKAVEDPNRRDWGLNWIARDAANHGQLDRALQAADLIVLLQNKGDTLREIAESLAQAGQPDQAETVVAQALVIAKVLDDDVQKDWLLDKISRVYETLGHYAQALPIAQLLTDPLGKADALADIARGNAKAGRVAEALQITHTLNDNFAKYEALMSVVKALEQTSHKEEIAEITAQAVATAQAVPRESLTLRQRWPLNRLSMARRTLTPAEVDSFYARALVETADQYARIGQRVRAFDLLASSIKAVQTIQSDYAQASALAEVARAYARIGESEHARELAEKITEATLRQEVLAEITPQVEEPFPQENPHDDPRAQEEDGKQRAIAAIAIQYAQAKLFDFARQVANLIEDQLLKTNTLLTLNQQATHFDPQEKVTETFSLRWSEDDDFEKDWVRMYILPQVAEQYTTKGQYKQALAFAQTMRDDPRKAKVLAEVAVWHIKAGAREKAHAPSLQAFQIVSASKDIESKVQALAAIGFSYTKAGLKIDDAARGILHNLIASLADKPWSRSSEGNHERRRPWGLVDPQDTNGEGRDSLNGYKEKEQNP